VKKKRAKRSKRVKLGTSKAEAAKRRQLFKVAWLANGGNCTAAALAAGFSPKTAGQQGSRLMTDPAFAAELRVEAEKVGKIVGLDLERTLREVARLAYSDPRKLYDADGNLIPVLQLDDDTAATVASVEVEDVFDGRGEARRKVGELKKIKHWDKNAALEKAMKYHGLYEKDNEQQRLPTNVSIHVVGIEPARKSVNPR